MTEQPKYFVSLNQVNNFMTISKIHIFGSYIEPVNVGYFPCTSCDCLPTNIAGSCSFTGNPDYIEGESKDEDKQRILVINVVRRNSPALSYGLTTGECKHLFLSVA